MPPRLPGSVDPSIYTESDPLTEGLRRYRSPAAEQALQDPLSFYGGSAFTRTPNEINKLTGSMAPFVQDVADYMALKGKILSDRVLEGIQRLYSGQLIRRLSGAGPDDLAMLDKLRYIPPEVARAFYGKAAPNVTGFTVNRFPNTIYLTDPGVMADLALGLSRNRRAIKTGAVGSAARGVLKKQYNAINLERFVNGPTMVGQVDRSGYLVSPDPLDVPGMTTLHELGHLNVPRTGNRSLDETLSDYFALLRKGLSPQADQKLLSQLSGHIGQVNPQFPSAGDLLRVVGHPE